MFTTSAASQIGLFRIHRSLEMNLRLLRKYGRRGVARLAKSSTYLEQLPSFIGAFVVKPFDPNTVRDFQPSRMAVTRSVVGQRQIPVKKPVI